MAELSPKKILASEEKATTTPTGVGKQLHTLPSHPILGEPQGF